MKSGRELDALVAEHVMGWDRIHCKPGGNVAYGRPDDDYRRDFPDVAYEKRVPAYSTNIIVAFTVDKPGWLWRSYETPKVLAMRLYMSHALRDKAMLMYPRIPKEVVLVLREWLDDKASTYAWMRCLAALEAVGVGDE